MPFYMRLRVKKRASFYGSQSNMADSAAWALTDWLFHGKERGAKWLRDNITAVTNPGAEVYREIED